MTAAGIIPARYQSTRLPGKVLLPLDGYPMLYHVYRRASQCRQLREVIVATDSEEVATACNRHRKKVVMTGSGRFVEVQGSGEGATFTRAELDKLLRLASGGIKRLIEIQEGALRRRLRAGSR